MPNSAATHAVSELATVTAEPGVPALALGFTNTETIAESVVQGNVPGTR